MKAGYYFAIGLLIVSLLLIVVGVRREGFFTILGGRNKIAYNECVKKCAQNSQFNSLDGNASMFDCLRHCSD